MERRLISLCYPIGTDPFHPATHRSIEQCTDYYD